MSKAGDEFTTKDSGERVQWSTGMQRDTTKGKQLWSLLIPLLIPFRETMLYRWVMLLTRGAEKYSSRNWEKARTPEELDRFKDSAFRHFMQWFNGETDEDHAAAVYFNINGAEYVKSRLKGRGMPAVATEYNKVSSTYRPTIPMKPENFGQAPTPPATAKFPVYYPTNAVDGCGCAQCEGFRASKPTPTPEKATPKYRSLGEDEKELLLNGRCPCAAPSCSVRESYDALVDRVVMPLPVAPLLPPEPAVNRLPNEYEQGVLGLGRCQCDDDRCEAKRQYDDVVKTVRVSPPLPPEAYDVVIILDEAEGL